MNITRKLALSMLVFGTIGCLIGGILSVAGFCPASPILPVIICGGYGAFLVGLLGGELYLLLRE